jgi:hypothetical protein
MPSVNAAPVSDHLKRFAFAFALWIIMNIDNSASKTYPEQMAVKQL